jgi:hypothetical protein
MKQEYAAVMTWGVDREGGLVFVDLTQVLVGEWEAVLDAVKAALIGSVTFQVVIYSSVLAVGSLHAALMTALTKVVEARGINVRAVYYGT